MERPSGPLGAATQSTGRPMTDTRPPPPITARRAPQPIQHAASNSSQSTTQVSISAGQVVALAREAMRNALDEHQSQAAEASSVSDDMKPGVTVDLSHKHIQRFPEEVVDIIKNELERLALSHNLIVTFPLRFAECTSLRYLNVRNNLIREFPEAICQLSSLEILDLGRNKLRILPPELIKLTSLKVLSVQRNRIETLPLCLADMVSLQVLKLDGNPIYFPPKEILEPQSVSPPNGATQEAEFDELSVTSQIKKFLKQQQIIDRSEAESTEEEYSEGTETPRPMKRGISGRFPVKVNGAELPDLRSPALPRFPPPIPSRSHYRGLSQQTTALRRPGVQPLTIGSSNERLRSNSEGLLQASRDRTAEKSRRMGIVQKKSSDLGTLDEMRSNRYSHYRGLSHGSAMTGQGSTNGIHNSRSPISPADSANQRATYVRRLSSLPERKRKSVTVDPIIEGAQGILFALFQVHPLVQNLLGLVRDPTNKRTSVERVFYNATTHLEELDREVNNYITYSDEDEELSPRSNENVHSACETCVLAYIHVCELLARHVDTLVANTEPRYIRSLLLLVYGSLAEVRNASVSLFSGEQNHMGSVTEEYEDTLKSQPRDRGATPTRDRPGPGLRSRTGTIVHHPNNLRVATDAIPVPFLNGLGRSATLSGATPRSGESFASSNNSGGRVGSDFSEEDRIFEKIYLRLQQSTEMALKSLPHVNTHFIAAMKVCGQQSKPDLPKEFWQILIQKCTIALQTAEALKSRLSLVRLKEPGVRSQTAFWELCNSFLRDYLDLIMMVKEAKSMTNTIPVDVIILLRPLQKVVKECGQLIQASPWADLAHRTSNGMTNGNSYSVQSPALQVQLPMTPQSAALGPAVQATVPSTPQSGSYNAMFSGNVFERADALLSMTGGSSAVSSRAGTMTSTVGGDSFMTPATILSPLNSLNARYNGNGKVTF